MWTRVAEPPAASTTSSATRCMELAQMPEDRRTGGDQRMRDADVLLREDVPAVGGLQRRDLGEVDRVQDDRRLAQRPEALRALRG